MTKMLAQSRQDGSSKAIWLDGRLHLWITSRQWDVLRELLRDGAQNSEIAQRLFLSEDTVKTHFRRIQKLAKYKNRTELAIKICCDQIILHKPRRSWEN